MKKLLSLFVSILLLFTGCARDTVIKNSDIKSDSNFEVHFIDVGQADSALVICEDKHMLIDGGNTEDSSRIYTYLKNRGITHLDVVVATHAHEDHIGGLPGALSFATVDQVYCPVTYYESQAFENFLNYVNKANSQITVPKVGDTFELGSADVEILAVNTTEDTNNSSIVLKITYGDTSFLFTGDAEREVEQALLVSGADLSSTVLKVGHHGSDTSTSYVFLREVMPKYAVISVGNDNEYGHPTDDVLSRLRDADVKVYRTDIDGDIICTSDSKDVTFSFPNNKSEQTVVEDYDYVLNKNSRKFHYPYCSSVDNISEKNKDIYFGTRDALISQGYAPCGSCKP